MTGYLGQLRRPRKAMRHSSFKPLLDVLEDRVQPSAGYISPEPLMPIDPIPPIGDSPGVISVSTQYLQLTRGGPSESFTVVLNSQPSAEVDATLAVYDPDAGMDGTTVALDQAHLVFTTDDWNTPQTINVSAAAGTTPLDDAELTILGTTTSADANFDAQAVPPITVDVTDPVSTPPGVVLSNQYLNVTRGGNGDSFTMALATQPTDNVTVTIAQSGGDALQVSPTTLTFTPQNWSTAQMVSVGPPTSGAGDQDDTLTLTDSSNDPNYNNGDLPTIDVQVTDPAAALAGVVVSTSTLTVTAGGPSVTYTLALASQPSADVTIAISQFSPILDPPLPIAVNNAIIARPIFGGGSATTLNITPQTLTFTSDNWSTPQTVTVSAPAGTGSPLGTSVFLDDAVTSNDANYDGIWAPEVSVNVQSPYGLVLSTQHLDLTPGASASYTIALASQPSADVTVAINQGSPIGMAQPMAPGIAFAPIWQGSLSLTISPQTLTFTPDDWNTPQTVTVAAVAGSPGMGVFGFASLVSTVTSSDPNYNNIQTLNVYVSTIGPIPVGPPVYLPPVSLPPVVSLPVGSTHPITPPKHSGHGSTGTTTKMPKPPTHTPITVTKHPTNTGTKTTKHPPSTGTTKPKPVTHHVVQTHTVTGWTTKNTHGVK